ncbi:anthranilate synthase component 1 [Ningiella sp. W23]|uniref:anthranilate synthase component 1 n=1 Tax=Ningiella sp. W23 TaxID=3023715 RepID=UPI003758198F
MSLAQLGTQSGKVETIFAEAPYLPDPLQGYQAIAGKNSVLLESAEIDSKDNLQSLILCDAALRIECQGQQVLVQALTQNGRSLLPFLSEKLPSNIAKHNPQSQLDESQNNTLEFVFEKADDSLDEDSRLKQPFVLDVLRTLQSELHVIREHPHCVFLGGVFSYDLLACFESLPEVKTGLNTCPDYVFYLAETLLLIDHKAQTTQILGSVFSSPNVAQQYFDIQQRIESIKHSLESLEPENDSLNAKSALGKKRTDSVPNVDKSDKAFCQEVEALQEHILDGDIFQVVPSRTFSLPCPEPLLAYRRLKQSNPSPYMFFLSDQDFSIFGASPESALKYDKDSNQVEIYPIAGTRPRGKRSDGTVDLDLDSRLELNLQQDSKEKAEHIMLVDLARNDVAKVSKPGSRHVKDLLKVDRYSHVMHLVSRVVGELRDDLDGLHAYQACMNMGTLVGAPKISAATLIRETEGCTRGSYGGAVGYLNGHGDFDTCIVIRSAFVTDDTAYVQAGAGVVKDSMPQAEADETRAKAQAVVQAVTQSLTPTTSNSDDDASLTETKGA